MDELETTTEAVIAGDQAHLVQVADRAAWERRGLLQRLARADQAAGLVETRPGPALTLRT